MPLNDQLLVALEAYQEIQAELHRPEDDQPPPVLDAAIVEPLLNGALMLGLAEDGLPVTLELLEASLGPLLIAGDSGSGKTALMQSIAGMSGLHLDLNFAVLSPYPEEWANQEGLPNCAGIWDACHPSAALFLEQLMSWAECLSRTRQVVLLFVDGIDLMGLDPQVRFRLRWLLANGPQAHIWPLVAVDSRRLPRLGSLGDHFHTRIFGRIRRAEAVRIQGGPALVDLSRLEAGSQFCLFWEQGFIRFWLFPSGGQAHERGDALVR